MFVLTGWAWHTRAISSQEAPYSMAKAASLINSPAPWIQVSIMKLLLRCICISFESNNPYLPINFASKQLTGPIMCAPISLSVFLSANTLTNPSVSLFVFALLLAAKGNLPTVYSTPSDFRSSSDFPTHATWISKTIGSYLLSNLDLNKEESSSWLESNLISHTHLRMGIDDRWYTIIIYMNWTSKHSLCGNYSFICRFVS